MLSSNVVTSCKDAPWVVFFHGFGGNANTWQKQIADYSRKYNLLLLSFHGTREDSLPMSVEALCGQIAETLKYHGVACAYIVSLSSGSLIALAFAGLYPEMVKSMVMAGGILTFNFRTAFLLFIARILRNIVPYMCLYRFFAFIILPRRNHKKSRYIFVQEAKKLGHREFCRWLNFIPLLKKNKAYVSILNNLSSEIPILYIMGSEDYLFKSAILKDSAKMKYATVEIIPACGHVCCIESADAFNIISLEFLAKGDGVYESKK